jgi:hypothetical protein
MLVTCMHEQLNSLVPNITESKRHFTMAICKI